MAGNTYVCEDEIPRLLQEKCLTFGYEGTLDGEELEEKVCGRDLIDFLNGYSLQVPASSMADSDRTQMLHVLTGNDLPMVNLVCLRVNDQKVCWEKEPVAKPFDFIDNRCRIDPVSDQLDCLGPTTTTN